MNIIDNIKDFLYNISIKYRNIDNVYKYQYLYDTHIIEISSSKLFSDNNFMEDEFKFSMQVMEKYGETVLFVSPIESLHVIDPEFIFSFINGQVKVELEEQLNFSQVKNLLDKYVDIYNDDIKTYTRKDFNIDSLSFSNSMSYISIYEKNDSYELHSNIDSSNYILAA